MVEATGSDIAAGDIDHCLRSAENVVDCELNHSLGGLFEVYEKSDYFEERKKCSINGRPF